MGKIFGRGKAEKEARRQEDIARQAESVQNIGNQFLAQLIPGSPEFNTLQQEISSAVARSAGPGDEQEEMRQLGAALVSAQQARVAGQPFAPVSFTRGASDLPSRLSSETQKQLQGAAGLPLGVATAQEARTKAAFGGLRQAAQFTPEEQEVFDVLRFMEGRRGTPTGNVFADIVARAREPERLFQSTLAPQLQLATDVIWQRFAQRGIPIETRTVTGEPRFGGLPLEALGRAGVEKAIQEAQAQEEFRRGTLADFERLFNVAQQLRRREIGVEEALTNLQLGRESRLTDLLGAQSSRRLDDLVGLLNRERTFAASERQAGEVAGAEGRRSTGQAIGTGLGALGGFLVGGPPGAAVGAGIGGQIGGGVSGGGSKGGTDVSSLLGASRQPTVTGSQTSGGVASLSRQPRDRDLQGLLAFLQRLQVR